MVSSSRYSGDAARGGVVHRVESPPEEAEDELAEVKDAVEQEEVPGELSKSCGEVLAAAPSWRVTHAWKVSQRRTRLSWYTRRSTWPRRVPRSSCMLQRLAVGLKSSPVEARQWYPKGRGTLRLGSPRAS